MSQQDWQEIEASVVGETNTTAPVLRDAAVERQRDSEQRRRLRYGIAIMVVLLLWTELIALFALIVWQGRGHFHLNEWMFGFLTNGVLLQTFFSLRTIITHLFPKGETFNNR